MSTPLARCRSVTPGRPSAQSLRRPHRDHRERLRRLLRRASGSTMRTAPISVTDTRTCRGILGALEPANFSTRRDSGSPRGHLLRGWNGLVDELDRRVDRCHGVTRDPTRASRLDQLDQLDDHCVFGWHRIDAFARRERFGTIRPATVLPVLRAGVCHRLALLRLGDEHLPPHRTEGRTGGRRSRLHSFGHRNRGGAVWLCARQGGRLFGSIFPIGTMIAPIFGGLFVAYWSWRGIFFVNVPIGLVLVLLCLKYVPRDPERTLGERRPVDVSGMLLLGMGMLSLMVGISELGEPGRRVWTPVVIAPIVVGVVGIGQFVRHIRGVANPFISPRLISGRGFAAVNMMNVLYGGATTGLIALVPLYAVDRYHMHALGSGTLLAAEGGAVIVMSTIAAMALRVTGYRL